MEDKDLLVSMVRDLRIKIEVLKNELIIEEMYGIPISGSITTAGNSNYRRTGQLSFHVLEINKVVPNEESMIWFDKTIKIHVGLVDKFSPEKDKIIWFELGVFAILDVSFSKNGSAVTASINIGDLMSKLDGALSGTIGTKTQVLNNGVSINTALEQTAGQLGKVDFQQIKVNGSKAKVPYKIEQAPGSTVYQLLLNLVQLYRGYEIFFDKDGYLICQQIRAEEKDAVIWDFTKEKHDLRITNTNNFDLKNVKNSVVVWGRILDNGKQIYWRYRNRFLRHHILKKNYPDYSIIDIPFTFDLEIGDICHINDVVLAKESVYNKKGEEFTTCIPSQDRLSQFMQKIKERERSYVWTNFFNYSESIMTDNDGVLRLSRWAAKEFDIIVSSAISTDELMAVKLMDRATIGENDSRYYRIMKINPEPIENEILQINPNTDKKEFLFSKMIYDVNDVTISIDGVIITSGFKITNRNSRGLIIFNETVEKQVNATYETFTTGGVPYKNKLVKVNYEYQTDKPYWVELDFLVNPAFRMEELGEVIKAINNDKNYNTSQARIESEFELWNSSNFAEKISLTCLPIYSLEANRKIKVVDEDLGVDGEYLIESFTTPLDTSSPMSIEATKTYYNMVNTVEDREPLPNYAPPCKTTSYLYPPNIINGYTYDILKNSFTIVDLRKINVKIYLSQKEIDGLLSKASLIPFEKNVDKELFLNKAKLIFSSLIFETKIDKEGFLSLYNEGKIFTSVQSAETSTDSIQSETTLKEVVENIHYIGKNNGYVNINFALGKGNTFDKIFVYKKKLPPEEYFDRYKDETCEKAWTNYPLEEFNLPPRDFETAPIATTENEPTLGFVRHDGVIIFPYEFYPHEYDLKIAIKSHFCANIKNSTWDLYTWGKMEEPTTTTEYPIIREDIVYFGAIPNSSFPVHYTLGLGSTQDKLEVIYNNQVLSWITVNPRANNWKPVKGTLNIDWKPINDNYSVIIRVTSTYPPS